MRVNFKLETILKTKYKTIQELFDGSMEEVRNKKGYFLVASPITCGEDNHVIVPQGVLLEILHDELLGGHYLLGVWVCFAEDKEKKQLIFDTDSVIRSEMVYVLLEDWGTYRKGDKLALFTHYDLVGDETDFWDVYTLDGKYHGAIE